MNENTCVCCGNTIPEGYQVCWKCERAITKAGTILQSYGTEKDVLEILKNDKERVDANEKL